MCGLSGDDSEGPASSNCMGPSLPVKKPIVAILPGLGAHPLAAGILGNGARAGDSNRGMLISQVLCLLNHKTGRDGRDLKIRQIHPLELKRGNRPRENQQLSQGLKPKAILSPDLKAMAGPQLDLKQRHEPKDLLRCDLAL